MTCVAGIIWRDGTVYMWSDKKGSIGDDVGLYKRWKIFQKEDMLIWFCGSFRLGQVIEVMWNPPERTDNTRNRAYEYIVEEAVQSLIELLREKELLEYGKWKTHAKLSDDTNLLIGYKWRLFQVEDDFSVLQREEDFNAIGSGSAAAMATLKTLKGQIYSKPKWAIKEAVHTAGTYVATVSKECTEILTLELNEHEKVEREKKIQKKRKATVWVKKWEPITKKENVLVAQTPPTGESPFKSDLVDLEPLPPLPSDQEPTHEVKIVGWNGNLVSDQSLPETNESNS